MLFIGEYGFVGLFLLSIVESIFFPIPIEIFLGLITTTFPHMWYIYAAIITVGSVVGGVISYLAGRFGNKLFLKKILSEELRKKSYLQADNFGDLAVFAGALLPIPYVLVSGLAGVFRYSLTRFIIVSILGRGTRFFILAFLIANAVQNTLLTNMVFILAGMIVAQIYISYLLWWK